jgi:hypothetical protein
LDEYEESDGVLCCPGLSEEVPEVNEAGDAEEDDRKGESPEGEVTHIPCEGILPEDEIQVEGEATDCEREESEDAQADFTDEIGGVQFTDVNCRFVIFGIVVLSTH